MKNKLIAIMAALTLLMAWGSPAYAEDRITYGEALKELGLIQGTDQGLKEDAQLTREQMVTILARLSDREGQAAFTPPAVPSFSDVPKSHWAYSDIEKAYELGITTGIGGGKFGIGNKVTYQQAVTFLARVAGFDIDYANAIEQGAEIGINLVADKEATANLYRGDVFELMVWTLVVSTDDAGEELLIYLIPTIDPEVRDAFLDSNIFLYYNPMGAAYLYEAAEDAYEGDDEFLAEASLKQHQYTTQVAEVISAFVGSEKEVSYSDFFKAASKGGSVLEMPYDWAVYSEESEYEEFGIWGTSYINLDADGTLYGTVESTEGGADESASNPTVWQFGKTQVDGRSVDAYYVLMENEWSDGETGLVELFVLVDDKGVYKAAIIGSYGDGVYTRG
ncbi:S-layer homology domain-containing protein [Paenibacillus soyae]|uniref:S-layer homology domain-containing protein n=1 Tax=Paenibacillus soyae TaxID=2969249 RepID=A0A9X2MUD4_9BACL|nr:S-layer homology domain-containing protein [Paenibacillus soyae]MCR2805966.1 S-layer homology domain-containing protein [Paenibacillus soyae]